MEGGAAFSCVLLSVGSAAGGGGRPQWFKPFGMLGLIVDVSGPLLIDFVPFGTPPERHPAREAKQISYSQNKFYQVYTYPSISKPPKQPNPLF